MKKNRFVLFIIFICCVSFLNAGIWPFNGDKHLLNQAREEYDGGKYDDAVVSLNAFLDKGTVKRREKRAYLLLGQSYEKLNRPEKALNTYLEGIALNPKDEALKLHLGALYERSGMYSQAVEQYSAALALSPSDELAVLGLARGYAKEGFFSKAIDFYSQYRKIKDNPDASFWADYAEAYYRHKMYNEALFALAMALEQKPEEASYWFLSAKINRALQSGKDAYANIARAAALAPSDEEIFYTNVYWLQEDGFLQDASSMLQPKLDAGRPDAIALYMKYLILKAQGKEKEGRKYLERVVAYGEAGFILHISKEILKNEINQGCKHD